MRPHNLVWVSALLICVAVAVPQARADVVNGGFETGTTLDPFSGWTFTQGANDIGLSGVADSNGQHVGVVHSGNFGAFFGPTLDTSTLNQSISTTPGTTYHISFWLQWDGGKPSDFSVAFNGLANLTLPTTAFSYTQFGFDAVASGAQTNLAFTFRDDPGYWYMDDVSVNAASVPGPLAGAGLPGLLAGFGAVLVWYRKKRAAV